MPSWRFRELKKSELNRGTTEEEFFRGGESSIDSLVRESVQNSLDAEDRSVPGPVRVRFYVSGPAGASPAGLSSKWLSQLVPSLRAAGLIPADADGLSAMPFVVIEDFKTLGLCGSTTAARQSEMSDLEREFFYFFWRNVGITGKGGGQRGSWGLGKLVYPSASAYRSMFGMTVRKSDNRHLLMGLAGVGQHMLGENKWHDAFGFFGEFGLDPDDEDFVLPVETPAVIEEFRNTFRLKRRGEAGLSVVVPCPRDEEIQAAGALESFARSVLHQFAYPLAAGTLTVEIEGPARAISISRDVLDDVLAQIDWSEYRSEFTRTREAIELARWTFDNSEQVIPLSRKNEASVGANWDNLQLSPELLESARERFHAREPVAFEVPVLVRRKNGEKALSLFQVSLRQRDDLPGSHCSFVRQGLTITDVPGPVGSGLVALTVVEDLPLAELLRSAENPAHTRWSSAADRLKQNFTGGGERVQVVTAAPREILRILLNSDAEVDRELLADLFPEPSSGGLHRRVVDGKGRKKRKGKIDPPPRPQPSSIRVDTVSDGFVVVHVPAVKRRSELLQLNVAFDCVTGSPWAAYERFDFDVSQPPIATFADAAEIISLDGNKIVARVRDGFMLRVTGFDTSRDLIIDPRWLPPFEEGGAKEPEGEAE